MLETAPRAPVTLTAEGASSLGEMFRLRAKRSAQSPAMWQKSNGVWDKTTWREFYDEARQALAGLVELGLEQGDKVAILGDTKKTWAVLDMAAQLGGFVSFGIYPKQPPEGIHYLLEHADARLIFVDSQDELARVREAVALGALPKLLGIVPWEGALYRGHEQRLLSPARFGLGTAREPLPESDVTALLSKIKPSDTAILVYTSGTTGPPKGAMISHFNILDLLRVQTKLIGLQQDDIALSFLPMAHVAERVLSFYGRICAGVATAFATSTATVLDELKEVQPTVFGSVPRIFEKAYAKLQTELEKKPAAVRRLFAWALDVSTRKVKLEHEGKRVPKGLELQHRLADVVIWKKVRAAFGGRVRMFLTGAAPISKPILELFWAAGLPVYEAYGMTEATVSTHINRPGSIRLGSVGRVIAPMECRIAADGEVLLRGPWVFQGYYKQPEATAETIIDGWLHTGDVGQIDEAGFLTLTDRKKHLIITAGGKNLSPANIEKAIREASPLISQVHAHGDRRPYVVAIIAPSPLETLAFGLERGLVTKSEVDARIAELMASPTSRSAALELAMRKVTVHKEFVDKMREAVREGNRKLAQVESVRRFAFLDRDLSQERGELTPTMKIRRKAVETLHAGLLDDLYEDRLQSGHEA